MRNTPVQVSAEFKTQAIKAVASILLFILIYLLLITSAIGLTILSIYLGMIIILARPSFITIMLGLGLASFGVLILIFLLKFIFKSHTVDRSNLMEITKPDEQELFSLVEEIVKQVDTSFPKKIYLSTDVNASVFYDSNFWSMLFPIRKNLQIGLGLVNTVSKSELKAILSHEFGHFSQKSMKIGSYVYNVNQVIYNLLHDNDSYDRVIQSWANLSNYLAIFVMLALKFIQGIQWILGKIYIVVNKSYMSLSREMEFHADEIAASVTGYEPLKTSLLRMTLADHSMNEVLSFYGNKVSSNQKSKNLYREQSFVMNLIAQDSDLAIEHNFPVIPSDFGDKFNKSKLIVKDQWASHPSTEDRVAKLEATGFIATSIDNTPAMELFSNGDQLQRKLTASIFDPVQYEEEASTITYEIFREEYIGNFTEKSFPKMFAGYYDSKNIEPFDLTSLSPLTDDTQVDDLYADEKVELVYTSIALQNDLATLIQIRDKQLPTNTFDYDGKKYKRKHSKTLVPTLQAELNQVNQEVKNNDVLIYRKFKQLETQQSTSKKLEQLYTDFFNFSAAFDNEYAIYTNLSADLQFISTTTAVDEIRENFRRLIHKENTFKAELTKILEDESYIDILTADERKIFETYSSNQWTYFGLQTYYDESLEVLFDALNNYALVLSRKYFELKLALLKYQASLVN